MGKAPSHKVTNRKAKRIETVIKCDRQFPECPENPNDTDCKSCPFYK